MYIPFSLSDGYLMVPQTQISAYFKNVNYIGFAQALRAPIVYLGLTLADS